MGGAQIGKLQEYERKEKRIKVLDFSVLLFYNTVFVLLF